MDYKKKYLKYKTKYLKLSQIQLGGVIYVPDEEGLKNSYKTCTALELFKNKESYKGKVVIFPIDQKAGKITSIYYDAEDNLIGFNVTEGYQNDSLLQISPEVIGYIGDK